MTLKIHIWKVDSILKTLEGTCGLPTLGKAVLGPGHEMTTINSITWPSPRHVMSLILNDII